MYNILMYRKIITQEIYAGRKKMDLYIDIREDISMLLCAMGEICDLNRQQAEYDNLHSELADKLILLDFMFKEKFMD